MVPRSFRSIRCVVRGDRGAALLMVLILLLTVAGSSASFIWVMNQQQTRAGQRYRSAAAMAAVEAGIHRALAMLESASPDGDAIGRTWRPDAHTEIVRVGPLEGRFTLSVTDGPDNAIVITSVGVVAGTVQRLRARVYLASPALLAALHGTSVIRLEGPPAATFVLPYGAGPRDRPWIHLAAGQEIWFATTAVSINNPALRFEPAPGPLDASGGPGAITAPPPGPVQLLLARGAEVTLGEDHSRVDLQQLRVMGVYADGVILRTEALQAVPEVDRVFYQSRAATNTANAGLNEAVGKQIRDSELARKRDSLYTPQQFEWLQAYLRSARPTDSFKGCIYVQGEVALREGERLVITDGALITEGTAHVGHRATLEITHSAATRRLPGLIVLDHGALTVAQGARLRVHGLVYANRIIDVGEGARVDIVGAMVGNDPGLSFRNHAATVVIRYDPAVLGTPGLHVPAGTPAVAWVAAWEELR